MIVIALGGNAILPSKGRGTIQEQMAVARGAMSEVAELIASGHRIVITHGNGPIIGNVVLRNDAAKDRIPPMPIDVCGADTQGGIGYMLQQLLGNELLARGMNKSVVSLVTQCIVREDDAAFGEPTKPIGPFYSGEEAAYLARTKGWAMVEDSGRGHRRVVSSPRPLEIVEWEAIRSLILAGVVVIAAGGGGVPVVRGEHGVLRGVEAVIDKDRAAAVLARQLGARRLVILTAVDRVALDFGKPSERFLSELTTTEARRHLRERQFPPGSMGPKIEAVLDFLESGGEDALITSPQQLTAAFAGESGTRIRAGGGQVS
jgi:carbamate kinase